MKLQFPRFHYILVFRVYTGCFNGDTFQIKKKSHLKEGGGALPSCILVLAEWGEGVYGPGSLARSGYINILFSMLKFSVYVIFFVSLYRVIASHVDGNPNLVGLLRSGTGGPSEMVEDLKDDEVMYCLGKDLDYIIYPYVH